MDDELSAAERQMIEILREWAGDPGTYRLTIEYTNGGYEIEFSMPNRGGRAARRRTNALGSVGQRGAVVGVKRSGVGRALGSRSTTLARLARGRCRVFLR